MLLVANTEGNDAAETEAIRMMLEHKVKGILYSTWFHRAAQIPPSLREADFVMSSPIRLDLPCVSSACAGRVK